jgi:hypothetical protein
MGVRPEAFGPVSWTRPAHRVPVLGGKISLNTARRRRTAVRSPGPGDPRPSSNAVRIRTWTRSAQPALLFRRRGPAAAGDQRFHIAVGDRMLG